jgi:voltage-gated potassium channel
MSKFLREPPSTRVAASVIVAATTLVVVLSGVLIRLVDSKEYPNVFVGMWWAMQTVTTVGYGDVTPHARAGRLVATVVMLEGIAFLAIVTAAITSTFVSRAQRERLGAEGKIHDDDEQRLHDRFDQLESHFERLGKRLDRVESALRNER